MFAETGGRRDAAQPFEGAPFDLADALCADAEQRADVGVGAAAPAVEAVAHRQHVPLPFVEPAAELGEVLGEERVLEDTVGVSEIAAPVAAEVVAREPSWLDAVASTFTGHWDEFTGALAETDDVPLEVWVATHRFGPLPVGAAATVVVELDPDGPGYLDTIRELFERSIDPAVHAPIGVDEALSSGWFDVAEFVVPAVAVSRNTHVLDAAFIHVSGGWMPRSLADTVADRLIARAASTVWPSEIAGAADALSEMCELHGHLMLSARARSWTSSSNVRRCRRRSRSRTTPTASAARR